MQKILYFLLVVCCTQASLSAQHCGALHAPVLPDSGGKFVKPRGSIARIPVVVHVVYRTPEENISDEQILSQMDVLNQDYRALNDLNPVLPFFENLVADMEIEFCLASRDPNGSPSNGITRTPTSIVHIGNSAAVHYSNLGGRSAWNPEHYLNIWVASMGPNLNGRASFPGQGNPMEDGVVVDPRYFGTVGLATAPYDLGRTCTHEVGHYLNLLHPWGAGAPTCDTDDEVEDTPNSANTFLNQCPGLIAISCASPDMFSNFMYFTDDACMGQFTPGQKARAWETLMGFRKSLLDSEGCRPVSTHSTDAAPSIRLYPQPCDQELWVESGALERNWNWVIRNIQGQALLRGEAGLSRASIDVSALPPGLYLLELRGSGWQRLEKVIVSRL